LSSSNRRFYILLFTLILLLGFSLYMTFYTISYSSDSENQVVSEEEKLPRVEFSMIFPENPSMTEEIARYVAYMLNNETIVDNMAVISPRCPRFYFKTENNNLIQIIYCIEGHFYHLIYSMREEKQLTKEPAQLAMDILQRLANETDSLRTEIIVEEYISPDNILRITVYQAVDGIPIERSGVRIVVNKASNTLEKMIIYPIYMLSSPELPKPNYTKLTQELRKYNKTLEEPTVKSILICLYTATYKITTKNTTAWIEINTGNIEGLTIDQNQIKRPPC